jgi:hypothetical protein
MPYRAGEKDPPVRKRGLQECLACHAVVLPTAARECPACRRNVDEVVDDGRRSITVRDGAALPGVCVVCGSQTDNYSKERYTRTDLKAGGHSVWFRIALAMVWPIALFFTRSKQHERIHVHMPHCRKCELPAPEHVDFEQKELTFLVHRNLYAAVRSGAAGAA